MSETLENQDNQAITQAMDIIDRNLVTLHQRELVSTVEMADLLLDVRSALVGGYLPELEEAGAVPSAN